ncbi:MAG TPA: EscU/YscU/HrcU family type III secretion system export apparatus switch protein [Treponemataceae bacterium]|jgi:flagellar biosynthesis protein|nr:MAG: flagellar biosynthesis protein FlhB [Spirochaetes bacterium ADurb.Bin269]TAH55394.1 MAG: flagellar biosynthesis protein FlhB [Treponema sp.]HOC29568.1 EscU/YscU/HrcU family type III secretion system export apparatus switch protein [Treponemataceae bacterium]HPX46847.1 EscU/YscU/HrcU family type III secretion system export apparatus switch protein [Treponemataceae bacterium]HQL32672.1 EscU/YscU/HrcU family type III secretion system export apparatus switch protein [Treponemataceae bacteri
MSKKAVALAWTVDLCSPVIIASGKDALAERMLEIAREYGIKTVSDPILTVLLAESSVGSYIPPEAWNSVAAVFAFLDEGIKKRWFM